MAHDEVAKPITVDIRGGEAYRNREPEVRGFDADEYYVHNSFRSPGKLDLGEIGQGKAEVYQARYDNFRTGLSVRHKLIDASCADDLQGVTFAFVSVDKGTARAGVFELLIALGIPLIDVGMGLDRRRGQLNGMLRTTYYPPERARELRDRGLAELVDRHDDLYRSNIQIGELNALNAGCGSKISTPLAPTDWSLHETDEGPSLRPSVGNWQLPCQSHYWIEGGKILWYGTWSPEQIEAGRRAEVARRQEYYVERERQREGFFWRLWRWFLSLFR